MIGKSRLGLIGQAGTYSTTGPTVDLGAAVTGARTAASAYSSGDLVDGQHVTVLIQSSDLTKRAVWASTYDQVNNQFDRLSEILSLGSAFSDSEAVTLYVVDDGAPPALYTPAVNTNAVVLDCGGYHKSYHKITLDANINASGISLANIPLSGVIELIIEIKQSGGPFTCPVTAWSGISGLTFDTVWYLYSNATPTIVLLRSLDGGTTWRARNNTPASSIDLADYGSGSAGAGLLPVSDGSGGVDWTDLGLGTAAFTNSTAYAPASEGVTNGNTHNHDGGDGGQIAYGSLSGAPTIPAASDTTPTVLGTAAAGTSADFSRSDHVHTLPKLDDTAAPDDNTDLNASSSAHGLLPKLSGTSSDHLSGTGAWTTIAALRALIEAAAPSVVTITGNTTLTAASHQGKVLYCTTGALSLTVDNSTDFANHTSCEIINKTGAVVTLVATATINRVTGKPLTIPANGRATLYKETTADTYLLTGEMA